MAVAPGAVSKAARFRQLLTSAQTEFACEAHNGLSAKIVEEAGFDAIWASGLTISSQLGVRDNNEASWTQVLDVLEFMADATTVPILVDGDTGYGNFNNVQRLVRKLEQRSIAAVCLEDKEFPKTNSFIDGRRQKLAEIDEFAGRIKAGKDAQTDPAFSIIARTEAFIAGWGLEEALRRAEAYRAAGADGILIHSARKDATEVLAFKREWADRGPVVIVPTTYYATPTAVFEQAGFSIVIWANQILRGAIAAMSEVAARIARERSVTGVDDRIVPVIEVFRLQGAGQLKEAEARYLPKPAARPTAVVLAASRGEELGELTADRPKAMVPINGVPLLAHIVAAYNATGINDVRVVRGYRKEAIDLPGIEYVENDEYATTGELVSLRAGLAAVTGDGGAIVSYGDVVFRKYIAELLSETDSELAVAVDTQWRQSRNRERVADYVTCSAPYSRDQYGKKIHLVRQGPDLPESEIHGESMGFLRISGNALPRVCSVLDELLSTTDGRGSGMAELVNDLIARGERIEVIYTSGGWCDVDSLEDVVSAAGL